MGARTAYISIALSLCVCALTCIGLPLHRLHFRWFFGLGSGGDMYIHALWVRADMKLLAAHLHDPWFAARRSTWDMRQVVDRMCSPWNRLKFGHNFCDGLQAAYGAGMFLFAGVVINALFLQGFAAFLLYSYAVGKPSRKTRTTAAALLVIGLFLLLACLLIYLFAVTIPLDSYDDNILRQAFIGESPATGFDFGLYVLIVVMVCQLVQVLVNTLIQGTDEDIYEAMKEEEYCGEGYGATGYGGGPVQYGDGGAATYVGGAPASSGVYQVTDITIQPARSGQPPPHAFGIPQAW